MFSLRVASRNMLIVALSPGSRVLCYLRTWYIFLIVHGHGLLERQLLGLWYKWIPKISYKKYKFTAFLCCLRTAAFLAHKKFTLLPYTSLVPRLHSPAFFALCRKAGREPGIFHHVLRDVGLGCVVWCVVLLIKLRVTFFRCAAM